MYILIHTYLSDDMRVSSPMTDAAGRLMDKALHHHIRSIEHPLFDTPALILFQRMYKTTFGKFIRLLNETIASPC